MSWVRRLLVGFASGSLAAAPVLAQGPPGVRLGEPVPARTSPVLQTSPVPPSASGPPLSQGAQQPPSGEEGFFAPTLPVWDPPQLGWGWFGGVEAAVIRPRIADDDSPYLDYTVAPEFTLGWRSPYGRAVLFQYRFYASDSDRWFEPIQLTDPPRLVPRISHDRVDYHQADLDVEFIESEGYLFFSHQWTLGVRGASMFFERNQAVPPDLGGDFREKTHFLGLGPHAEFRFAWTVADTGVAIFGEMDSAILIGRNEGYKGYVDRALAGATFSTDTSALVFQRTMRAGWRWTLSERNRLMRLSAGYQADTFSMQRIGAQNWLTRTNVINHGPFLKAEFRF